VIGPKRNLALGFYWAGVAMAVGCIALVVAGNLEMGALLARVHFPLAWIFAGGAVLALLAGELSHGASRPRETKSSNAAPASAPAAKAPPPTTRVA
jgi:hypothetical protein